MGLDTSHNAWHGPYSFFHEWRKEVARLKGIPLELMECFYEPPMTPGRLDKYLPLKWEILRPDAIHLLLHHSDCDGFIEWRICRAIADSLESVIPMMPEYSESRSWIKRATKQFIDGLRLAFKLKENLEFH